jgi:hypothetical protein
MIRFFYSISIVVFLNSSAIAQQVQKYKSGPSALLVENKGQVIDQNRKARPDVLMIFEAPGFHLAIREKGISYQLVTTQTLHKKASNHLTDIDTLNPKNMHLQDSVIVQSHRVDIDFMNSNLHPILLTEDENDYYENYYTEYTGEEGVTHIGTFGRAILKNVWEHIDIEFIAGDRQTFKYNFIIRPGGNIHDIQLKYNGATPELTGNSIKVKTSLGEVTETIPSVYYIDTNTSSSEQPSVRYQLNDQVISFAGDDINTVNQTLVIDPSLIWATYYGGSDDEWSYGLNTDDSGNVYITGYSVSTTGIATSGAYQTSNSGYMDAFLAKFNSAGKRKWATYYGGGDDEWGQALSTDDSGNVFLTGGTYSTSGIATANAYQTSLNTGPDVFLAKFSSAGKRRWGTYYGGNSTEFIYGITNDDSGHIYIGGTTLSSSGIATTGARKTTIAGSWDAFLTKFSDSGGIVWATYYGGSTYDYIYGVVTDDTGNVYVSGYTFSTSGISTSGSYQASLAGGTDAFIAKFSSADSLKWGTYFGGSGYELCYSIDIGDSGNLYLSGNTSSTSGIATSGAYQTANGGGSYDAFVAKFNNTGGRKWATYYGGGGAENCYGITCDDSENVYIAGVTVSTSGIATTGAYQDSFAGGSDAFLAAFPRTGNLSYATYYGGNTTDYCYGICSDHSFNIYISGYTQSTAGVATSGAHQTSLAGPVDAFLAKFYFKKHDAGLVSVFSSNDTICAITHALYVELKNYNIDTLTSDSIRWTVNGIAQPAIKWTGSILKDSSVSVLLGNYNFSTAGTYHIKSWSVKPNNIFDDTRTNDTAAAAITVNPLPIPVAGADTSICPGNNIYIGSNAVSGMIYNWSSNPSGFTASSSNPVISPSVNTMYYLELTDSTTGCKANDSVMISLLSVSSSGISASVCQGDTYSFGGNNITIAGTYLDTLVNSVGCDSVVTLNLNILPTSALTINDSICQGNYYSFGGNNITIAGTYFDTLTNIVGCDSVVTLHLNILSTSAFTMNDSICQGNYYSFGGNNITTAGTYFDTLTNSIGCDSVVTLNLNILPTSAFTINASICQGNYYSFGGNNITASGAYFDTLTNSIGCDSIVSLNLNILPTSAFTISAAICQGNYYSFGGNNITTAGTYFDTLTNSIGCDSVVSLNLNILPPSVFTINTAICQGNYYSFGGNNITTAGTYFDTLNNYIGCDSFITLNLSVNTLPNASISGGPTTFCKGDSVILSTGKFKQYIWSTGETSEAIVVKTTNSYFVLITDSNGCSDTSNKIVVKVNPLPAPVITNSNKVLQTGNYSTYQWYLNNVTVSNAINPTYTPTSNGSYTVSVTDSNGCAGRSVAFIVGWTGILSQQAANIHVFPNPGTGDFYIESNVATDRKLFVYDALGKLLFQKNITGKLSQVNLNETYPIGIYFFVITESDNVINFKVMKD